jgi:hypothetical protein
MKQRLKAWWRKFVWGKSLDKPEVKPPVVDNKIEMDNRAYKIKMDNRVLNLYNQLRIMKEAGHSLSQLELEFIKYGDEQGAN